MHIRPVTTKTARKKRDLHASFETQLRHERLHREYMAALRAGEAERAEQLKLDLIRHREPAISTDAIIREYTIRDGPTTH
ncbi:MAG: hypothetical protein AAFR27_12870 [Pseudomonadota bacterium]